MHNPTIIPFSLADAPSLIEHLLPVQKLSAESYKEQMAGVGKTLTALGSYWKGRKPLILAKACVLSSLLPASGDLARDLEIFELLMGMDQASLEKRLEAKNDKESRFILGQQRTVGKSAPYREWVQAGARPEECGDELFAHIWEEVNAHLGTDAYAFPELVEQLGVMRFGRRPRLADTFCGSGQIAFEAARLGCNVYASDLNPVASMLTWGAFHIVGGSVADREALSICQKELIANVQAEIDRLGVESDGKGWRGKIYLYCVEAQCPQSGWLVPLLPTRVVNRVRSVIAKLEPDPLHKRYAITIRSGVTKEELAAAREGTVQTEPGSTEPYLVHTVDSVTYRTKISTLRGDYAKPDGSTANRLRLWEKSDFVPQPGDIFQERLYAIQWMRPKKQGRGEEYDIRAVTTADLERERIVEEYVARNLAGWQKQGWLPDLRIEPGGETERLYRERGWTHWQHLFTPRQLLVGGLINRFSGAEQKLGLARLLNSNARLSRWTNGGSGAGMVTGVFDNQALNTLYNYGCRGSHYALDLVDANYKSTPFAPGVTTAVGCHPAEQLCVENDIYITDPPYGDAVKYEEILEFFIAWLGKKPPREFADWVWDSRRALAITGEDESFRQGMTAAYRRMAEQMAANGIQIVMFTHQSGAIWADMANIVWAAGLRVTAAWYVVTETDSALRAGSYVKGTVLLVLRKRQGSPKTTSDDLAWEIEEEVQRQVESLTGLNQAAKGIYRDENLFEDADVQMAGYAAALRVLTRYAVVNGREMASEAIRPRVKGEKTFVDELIDFAVGVANRSLVPTGISKELWGRLQAAERFYLKMLEMEAQGLRKLDNYQNFAKAFKVANFDALMASERANEARLKSASELGRGEMSEGSELHATLLRGALYALMEVAAGVDGSEVLAHLPFHIPNYYDQRQREGVAALADFLAAKLESIRAQEASAARILRELVRNQRM